MLHPLISNLGIATVMVSLTVVIHFVGLIILLRILAYRGHGRRALGSLLGQCFLVVFVVMGIVAIHTLEIWLYAALYFTIGAVPGDFETALYFSTVTFSTLGYGDIVLSSDWRVLGGIEAANGLILFGWSTAFLISLMGRLRVLEHDWLQAKHSHGREPGEPHQPMP
jgi:hypothetical protein